MLLSTERLLEQGFNNRVFKDWELAAIFPGSNAKRYAIMNKALKKREIIRLIRGVYMLSPKYHHPKISLYSIANQMVPNSFISFETALSFHGFIPEKITIIKSVIAAGRNRNFNTSVGTFEYINIPGNQYETLSGVIRHEGEGQPFLIAKPLRALADYVYITKVTISDIMNFLEDGLRIEKINLETITSDDFNEMLRIYKSKRVISFLLTLRKLLRT